jgi:hypothetical protein
MYYLKGENKMKKIILLLIIFFNLNIALADYKQSSVFKITNLDSVNTGENNKLINFTLDITAKTDTGIITEGKCVLTIKNNILEGNCENTDANKKGSCIYEVTVRNLKLGIGATEGTCTD